MTKPILISIASTIILSPAVVWGQGGEAQHLTFGEAISVALKNGPETRSAEQGVEASASRVSGAKSQRFPKLRAEANILYWDKPLEVSFGSAAGGTGMPAKLTIRDQTTSQVSLILAQPISGLFVLNQLVSLERNALDAARADEARAKLDTAQRASEAFVRSLQARALLGVAEQSVKQVEAQLARSKILEKGGALGTVDVLRLTSARDSARQSLLRARTGVDIAEGALVLALGLPSGTRLEIVDEFPDPPTPLVIDETSAKKMASAERPELVAARERAAQAQAGRSVAKAQLLPNINGLLTYQHAEGQGTFQPKNAWFVGATLAWDIWDWGKNWSGVKEAEARSNQAAIGSNALLDQILFEAERRVREARTAFDTIAVAKSALQAAEEAYRIQSVRYAEGAANTTDLLDAETDVSRARSGYTQARYDYYLSQAGLARAVGQLPTARLGEPNANR